MIFTASETGIQLDLRFAILPAGFSSDLSEKTPMLAEAMANLESGAIANPTEGRQVGHYWLRDADLAPSTEQREAILDALAQIKDIASNVHSGQIKPSKAERFTDLLIIGIGGSALGPQLALDALAPNSGLALKPHYFDNTDPDGFVRTLSALDPNSTLCLVISKSGGTLETLSQYHAFH